MLAVSAFKRVCIGFGTLTPELSGKFLVVDTTYKRVPDGKGLRDAFDFHAKVVGSPLRHVDNAFKKTDEIF